MKVVRRAVTFRLLSALALVAVATGLLLAVPADAAPPKAQQTAKLGFGIANAGGPLDSAELDGISTTAGEAPSSLLFYKDFQQAPPISELDAAVARGAKPIVTWEPWVAGAGVDQPAYSLKNITGGAFDSYISGWATSLASWGKPLALRFAHEMNGNWYPWAEGVNGNAAGDYVAAWRHVRNIFSRAGATNVTWLWSPNVPYTGSTPLSQLYPGAKYVDVVGLDGYNWGTSQTWSSWVSPQDLFDAGLSQLRSVAPRKPIVIAETASAEAGGSKPDWIAQFVAYLDAQPDVTSFVWFDIIKETDWRIDSTQESAAAFRAALASR
jgi:hypothetical protein